MFRTCNKDIVHIHKNKDYPSLIAADIDAGVSGSSNEVVVTKIRVDGFIPHTWCLFESVETLPQPTYILRVLGVDKSLRLADVDFFLNVSI